MALLARFFGRTASEGAAFAFGLASGPVLYPAVREIENLAWQQYQSRPVDTGTAAAIVAEDVERQEWGEAEAASEGISRDRFTAMVGEALNAPAVLELLILRRRNLISDAQFTHGLRKAKLETEWDGPLRALSDVLLTPQELANARQQGYIDQARQHSEAALQGIDGERAEIQYEMVGLPPGHAEAQHLLNRGLIDASTFAQMIREGHTKTKYTDVLRQAARRILQPNDWVQGRLRGWITDAEMYAGTAAQGITKDDTDLLFKIHGRPLSWHQVFIGLRRGGEYNGPTAGIAPAFLDGLRQSDIRPEWYNLAWAQRFNYPTAFVLRTLTADGDLTAAEAEQILLYEGWEPGLAHTVATKWAGSSGPQAKNPWVAKADNQLWTALHKQYVKFGSARTLVEPILTHIIADTTVRDAVFADWDRERQTEALPTPA